MPVYEIHLTISPIERAAWPGLAACADAMGATPLVIELARGVARLQPMLTLRHAGSFETACQAAEAATAHPALMGHDVRRCKIEREISDPAPENAPDCVRYFEWHGRLTVQAAAQRALAGLCQTHGGHLSANAQRHSDLRYVTLREAGSGTILGARVACLSAALAEQGWAFSKQRWECVVFDSNLDLDAGWLEP